MEAFLVESAHPLTDVLIVYGIAVKKNGARVPMEDDPAVSEESDGPLVAVGSCKNTVIYVVHEVTWRSFDAGGEGPASDESLYVVHIPFYLYLELAHSSHGNEEKQSWKASGE